MITPKNALETFNLVWNIVWGFVSYLFLALQLFWEEYGETIQIGAVKTLFNLVDLAGETFLLGRKSRQRFEAWLSRQADSAFFRLVDVQ